MSSHDPTFSPVAPSGQALIESLVFLVTAAALVVLTQMFFHQAEVSRQAPLSAWFDLQRCAAAPQGCGPNESSAQYVSLLTASNDRVPPYQGRSLRDQPLADTSGVRLVDRVSQTLQRFSHQTAETIFGLPEARRLSRVTSTISLGSEGPKGQSAIAMVGQDWSATGTALALSRVAQGATPSATLAQVSSAAYMPITGLLMPGLEAIGLESGSSEFRRSFHRLTSLSPFPGTLAPSGR
ncbi:MAG: hypothetical protein RLZZ344_208 [Pseudomonadota bacterium]